MKKYQESESRVESLELGIRYATTVKLLNMIPIGAVGIIESHKVDVRIR